MLDECDMPAVTSIGNNHTPVQGEDTHLVLGLQAIIPMIVVGQRGRDILGRSIQSLVAFLGLACGTKSCVVLHLRPQDFIGGPDMAGNIAGHLSRQSILQADIVVASSLQGPATTHLAMLKGVAAHVVEGITVRQLCTS